MSDKDFDRAFRDKFENFEMEVPGHVWEKVRGELDGGSPAKRSRFLTMKVAASVMLLLAATYWFSRPRKVIELYPEDTAPVAAVRPEPAKEDTRIALSPAISNFQDELRKIRERRKEEQGAEGKSEAHASRPGSEHKAADVRMAAAPGEQLESEPTLAQAEDPPVVKSPVAVVPPDTASKPAAELEETLLSTNHPRRPIKSVGDIINFVVGKVDKRTDKVIEFKDTDEGSLVSGINLGFVKFRSKD